MYVQARLVVPEPLVLHIGCDVWKDDENEMAAEEIALLTLAKINVPEDSL